MAAVPLLAQTGRITGKVSDASGAAVPGASVVVTQVSINHQRSTDTSSDGYYTVPNLVPGSYTVEVSGKGFRTTSQTDLQLQVDQTLRLDFALEIGTVNEQVAVQAQPPLLDTESQSVSQACKENKW